MLKRLVSSLVGVACLVSMTGAFAATYTGTTTEYDVSGKIRVKSVISGTADQTVTYLVHDKDATVATLQDGQVVYVDQYEFSADGTYTFNYLTDTTDIDATILLGGDIEGAIVNDTVGVKVKVNGEDVYVADAAGSAGYVLVPCDVIGKSVSEVALGGDALADGAWFAAADGLYITGLALNGSDEITFTAGETETADVVTMDAAYLAAAKADASDLETDEVATDSILAVGKVAGTVAEFGIAITYNGTTTYLEALGKNVAGAYAVRVYTNDFTAAENVTVQAYYKATAESAAVLADEAIKVK